MTPRDEIRLFAKLDAIDQRLGSIESQGAVTLAEVRGHEQRDNDRFEAVDGRYQILHSDIRELKSRVLGVEDTSRTQAVTAARAGAVLDVRTVESARAHDWRKSAIIAVLAAVLSMAATAIAQGI